MSAGEMEGEGPIPSAVCPVRSCTAKSSLTSRDRTGRIHPTEEGLQPEKGNTQNTGTGDT
jgi:hypothetical protein